jgi:transglutaminase-like putative cysteine protease
MFYTAALLTAFAYGLGDDAKPLRHREFLLTYQATVTDVASGQTARVWLPVPPTNDEQEAAIVTQNLPATIQIGREPAYGNHVLYTEGRADRDGQVNLSVTYRVTRREVRVDTSGTSPDMSDLDRFLQPDVRVPITGKPLALLAGRELPKDQLAIGRVLYDVVNNHMRYSKEGIGWGQGDVEWACDSRYGNCSDFHSLFISLARSQKIPAKFEIGFPLPEKRGEGEIAGYHCWAKFKPRSNGWVPVDISEASKNPKLREYYFGNLTEDRVTFSVGRDLVLVPEQDGPPLNFFIYPYVEVAGKPHPSDSVKRKFTFQDIAPRESTR